MSKPRAALAAVLLVFSGCGGEGDESSVAPVSGVLPAIIHVPKAAAASGIVGLVSLAATDVILDPLTQSEVKNAPRTFLNPHKFEGTSHDEFEIDLDALNPGGHDRFPDVSGIVLVTLDGLVQGTLMNGEASCSVVLEATTPIVATDPASRVEATIEPGASWLHSLEVTWEFTDTQNGNVIAIQTNALSVEGILVTEDDDSAAVVVSGGRQETLAIAKVDGQFVQERLIEGALTITIDDGQAPVEVLIEFQNDGLILVTIGADSFGPFTLQEFRKFFRVEFA